MWPHLKIIGCFWTHLPCETLSLWRLQKAVVHLVGPSDHGRDGILVVWSSYGEQW